MVRVEMKKDEKSGRAVKEAFEGYAGALRFDEPIAPYTSLKIGGPAEAMVFPGSTVELAALMARIARHHLPFFVLGGGSNLLVQEEGVEGVVIHLGHLDRIELKGPREVRAEAGVAYPKLSLFTMEKGLAGLEFAAGIPGTVGGAVAMNAGIPGEETASVLKEIALIDEGGAERIYRKEEIPFGYRKAGLPGGVVVSATFQLSPTPREEVDRKLKRLLKRRRETQPLAFPNVGSVFKNPPGRFAGKLVEEAGLKGHRIGDAQISERHGNFIINRGAATAREVLALIRLIEKKVAERSGISLEREVKVVGRAHPGDDLGEKKFF